MTDISDYNASLPAEDSSLADQLADLFSNSLTEATGKVWHGHPVWFIEGNPVAGYSMKKSGIQVLFWSGQSFQRPGLKALGKFKAASVDVADLSADLAVDLAKWLQEAVSIQWNYAALPKLKKLEKLTDF